MFAVTLNLMCGGVAMQPGVNLCVFVLSSRVCKVQIDYIEQIVWVAIVIYTAV